MKKMLCVIFVILILSSISFVACVSAEVYAPYNSPVFHEKGCSMLPSNERLMKFPSVQSAINSGAKACPSCVNQAFTGSTNQSQGNTAVPKIKVVPQEPAGIKEGTLNTLYCDRATGRCFSPKEHSYIEPFGDRKFDNNVYEAVVINVKPISMSRIFRSFAELPDESDPNYNPDAPATFEGKPIYENGKWFDEKFAIESAILSKGYKFFKQVERYSNGMQKLIKTGYGLSKDSIVVVHGLYEEFYKGGIIKVRADYKYGFRNGRYIAWYENGKLMHDAEYQNGKQHGIHKQYDSKGNLLYKDTYEHGEKTNRKAFDREGRLKFSTDY